MVGVLEAGEGEGWKGNGRGVAEKGHNEGRETQIGQNNILVGRFA